MIFFDMAAAFIVAAMSGLGIGGGGLLIIYLTLIKGIGQIEAQGINLLFFLFASGSSILIHLKKRKINFKLLMILIIFGITGSIAGSMTANAVNPSIIRNIFGIFLIASGGMTLLKK